MPLSCTHSRRIGCGSRSSPGNHSLLERDCLAMWACVASPWACKHPRPIPRHVLAVADGPPPHPPSAARTLKDRRREIGIPTSQSSRQCAPQERSSINQARMRTSIPVTHDARRSPSRGIDLTRGRSAACQPPGMSLVGICRSFCDAAPSSVAEGVRARGADAGGRTKLSMTVAMVRWRSEATRAFL